MANDRQHKITIDNTKVPSDQTGMPFLVGRDNYDDEVVDPSGSNAAKTDGTDQRFYTNDDQTGEMAREVVSFEHDSVTGAGDAICATWAQLDSFVISSTADTDYYVTYGDGSQADYGVTDTFGRNNVWGDLLSVLHLIEAGDGTAGEYVDSTGGSLTGRGGGGTAGRIPGQSTTNHPWGDNWQDFDGSNDYVQIENSGSALDSSDGFVSVWAIPDSNTGADEGVISNRDSSQGNNFFQVTAHSSGFQGFIHDGTANENASRGGVLSTTVASHIALSWSGSRVTSYLNGVQDQEDTSISGDGHFVTAKEVRIATYFDFSSTRSVNGRIGEAWMELSQPSDDRITTLYNNQSAHGTFATPGTPTAIGAGGANPKNPLGHPLVGPFGGPVGIGIAA